MPLTDIRKLPVLELGEWEIGRFCVKKYHFLATRGAEVSCPRYAPACGAQPFNSSSASERRM